MNDFDEIMQGLDMGELTPRPVIAAHLAYALTSPAGSALPGTTVEDALVFVAEHYDLSVRELVQTSIRLHSILRDEETS